MFPAVLRQNANYRRLWIAQVISEMGDWFNQVAVFTLALRFTGSPLAIVFVLIAQTVPSTVIGPIAGVILDRVSRKRALIISDLVRAVVALGPILVTSRERVWWLYALTALLASASPFFTAGRLALIPSLAEPGEILAANSITQGTHWTTLSIGSALAGLIIGPLGFRNAFLLNTVSFLGSAFFISRIAGVVETHRRSGQAAGAMRRPWREYSEGLRYIRSEPMVLALLLIGLGWATGGGAMQVLFSVFGDLVFHRGAFGIGILYGAAGLGLASSAALANWLGKRLAFRTYKRVITFCYLSYGAFYVAFSQVHRFWVAVLLIGLSRYFIGTSSVLNLTRLMQCIPDQYRGRVFSTNETITLTTMLVSMLVAGLATTAFGPRPVALAAGVLSGSTGLWWALANWRGKLREPATYAIELPHMVPEQESELAGGA